MKHETRRKLNFNAYAAHQNTEMNEPQHALSINVNNWRTCPAMWSGIEESSNLFMWIKFKFNKLESPESRVYRRNSYKVEGKKIEMFPQNQQVEQVFQQQIGMITKICLSVFNKSTGLRVAYSALTKWVPTRRSMTLLSSRDNLRNLILNPILCRINQFLSTSSTADVFLAEWETIHI